MTIEMVLGVQDLLVEFLVVKRKRTTQQHIQKYSKAPQVSLCAVATVILSLSETSRALLSGHFRSHVLRRTTTGMQVPWRLADSSESQVSKNGPA